MANNAPKQPDCNLGEAEQDFLEVLILDDLQTDRLRLIRLCKRAGLKFRTIEASSVEAFRALLRTEKPDIVFIDYALGLENGLDALEALQSDPKHADAISIMVSSLDNIDLAIEAMRKGCADYINKEELTVESVRKSLALAFERRILVASLAEAQKSESEMRVLVSRIAQTCGSEICAVIAATLGQLEASGADQDQLKSSLRRLDSLCNSLGRYLIEIVDEARESGGVADLIGPRTVADPK